MDQLTHNLDKSEQTINFLKEQLAILSALAARKRNATEKAEIQRIAEENERLRHDLVNLKHDLSFYEIQNGVVQVDIPLSQKAAAVVPPKSDVKKEAPPASASAAPKGNEGKKKKDGGKAKKQPATPAAEESRPLDASRLNMKIGRIVSVKKHEDADGLYVEQVDVGEEKLRTVVSGLVKYYTLEEMQNRTAVFLCNLKPAKMRGVLSEGMIMCASSPEIVEILQVPDTAAIGERVQCDGFPGQPDAQLNPKKKIWEQIQPDLNVGDDGVARYKSGGLFTVVGKGVCSAPSMKNCMVK